MNCNNQRQANFALTSLVKAGVFCLSVILSGAWPAAIVSGQESLPQRRERLANLSPEELKELKRKWDSFTSLSAQEQQRLRKLHQEISQDPNAARLRSVLSRYAQWFDSLSYAERGELREIPPEDRIEKMKNLFRQQDRLQSEREMERERRPFRRLGDVRLPREEAEKFFHWLEEFTEEHYQEITDLVPKEIRRRLEEKIPDEKRRSRFMLRVIVWKEKKLPALHEKDIQSLRESSPRLKQELDAFSGDPQEQKRLIQQWIRAASRARPDYRPDRRFRHRPSPEELGRFFREGLNDRQRSNLEGLPHDELLHELGRMYYHYRRFMSPHREGRPEHPPHPREGFPGERGPRPRGPGRDFPGPPRHEN